MLLEHNKIRRLKTMHECVSEIREFVGNADGMVYFFAQNEADMKFSHFTHFVYTCEYERMNNGGKAPRQWYLALLDFQQTDEGASLEFGIATPFLPSKRERLYTSAQEVRFVFSIDEKNPR